MHPENKMSAEADAQTSARMEVIEKFSEIIKDNRKAAIEGRRNSGIEEQWAEDEDAYEGRDKYNNKSSGYTKPRNTDGVLLEEKKAPAGRSTVIPNITRPYCDAASARVSDILLPTDDRNWAIRPTPLPKMQKNVHNQAPAIGQDGQPMMQPAPQPQGGVMSRMAGAVTNAFAPQKPVTVGELAQQAIDKAKVSSERAQEVIDDWLVESKYHGEVRKVIENTSIVGVGILKGPVPARKKARIAKKGEQGWTVAIEVKTVPESICVNHWNFYPDPNCGSDIQRGSFTFERDDITARGLRELKGGDYIDEMIDMSLEEGPIGSADGKNKMKEGQRVSDKDLFEIWYYHGNVSKKDMLAAGCSCEAESSPAIVTMVNDRVIKITMSPLDSGEYPYDVMVWQVKKDSWAGIGVARQIRTCQQGLTSAVRAMQDNSALSSGPQIIVNTELIEPQNGSWVIMPNKVWRRKVGSDPITDVRQAFTIVTIETRQVELLNIINYWTKTAEDVTGLPMLLQGQQGNAPDTLGATQIVNNNGSTVLRRIARNFDDRITEMHIGRYYEWLLLHGPDDAKGDMQIDARGSSALVERDIQNRAMLQLLGLSLNPNYLLDPELVAKEVLKGMRLDYKSFALSDEKKQQLSQNPPPEAPQVTVAKIRADADLKKEDKESKQKVDHTVAAAQMELQKQQFEEKERQLDRQNALVLAAINERMNSTKLTSDERNNLAKIKATLTTDGAKINLQKDLSLAQHSVDLHKSNQAMKPPVEPPGKAPNGEAFTQ